MKKFAVNGKATDGINTFKVLGIKNYVVTFEDASGYMFRRALFHTKDTEWCVKDMEFLIGKVLPM